MHRPMIPVDPPDGHAVTPVQSPTTPDRPMNEEDRWRRWLETDPAVWQRAHRAADATWTVRGGAA
jgi:hypothetical protein